MYIHVHVVGMLSYVSYQPCLYILVPVVFGTAIPTSLNNNFLVIAIWSISRMVATVK